MATSSTTFDYEVSPRGLGLNKPQQMGTKLWAPTFAIALMGFAVGFILAIARAGIVSDFGPADEGAMRLAQLIPAFMFIGFIGVFSAISFAIARILGVFRKSGGEIQEAVGTQVHTLKMPVTAKVFMGLMAMGMMLILTMVVLHLVVAGNVGTWSAESVAHWSEVLEGFRRFGTAMYLAGIAFGLGTIITVLRFQAERIRQLPTESRA